MLCGIDVGGFGVFFFVFFLAKLFSRLINKCNISTIALWPALENNSKRIF